MDFEVVKFGVVFNLYFYVHAFFDMVLVWDILLWFKIWYIITKNIDAKKLPIETLIKKFYGLLNGLKLAYFQKFITQSFLGAFQFFFLNMYIKEFSSWAFLHMEFFNSLITT